jgi:hypothetical protein
MKAARTVAIKRPAEAGLFKNKRWAELAAHHRLRVNLHTRAPKVRGRANRHNKKGPPKRAFSKTKDGPN